jgi:transposase
VVAFPSTPRKADRLMTDIAMDVHKKTSTLAYVTPAMEEPKVVRCHTTRADMGRVLAKLPRPWAVCLEATRQSPAVARWLRQWGADEIHLVNAQQLHQFVKDKPKTDARDAKEMLELQLMGRLPECYLATQEDQDRRTLARGRQFVRKVSTGARNTIRAALNQVGLDVPYSDLCGVSAQKALAECVKRMGPLAQVILPQLQVLLLVTEQCLTAADQQIKREADGGMVPQALQELHGVGPVISFGLWAEIARIDRFEDPAHLISYAGLAPKANDSDGYHGPRKLPKRCNKRLRHWACQGVLGACKKKAGSRAKATYFRLVKRKPKKVAIIAAARALLKDVFYRWREAELTVSEAA